MVRLAVSFDGPGWHPAAWRYDPAPATEFYTLGYWARHVQEAERGLLDFVSFEDNLDVQPGGAADFRGRFDAVQLAAGVAPLTRRIGLVPTATVTHTEPFHVSTAVATLDLVSEGRAGWQVRVSGTPEQAANFGRRTVPEPIEQAQAELYGEAADAIEVVRRLWDSWEDDAVIRDVDTGRYLDRTKLHYVDFRGTHFAVKGPSVTPRSPQGQPLVTALVHGPAGYPLTAGVDLVHITPADPDEASPVVAALRGDRPLLVFADLLVHVGTDAADRRRRWDDQAGLPVRDDAATVAGTAEQVADAVVAWHAAGVDGVRLRPASLALDLPAITRRVVPELQSRGVYPRGYTGATLRSRYGLPRPASRYAVA